MTFYLSVFLLDTETYLSICRRIRKKLKLTQKQAAEIFGGGPNAFSRYERSEATSLRSTSNLLRILDKHPEQLQELMPQRM